MISSQEITNLFAQLPIMGSQTELLDELLQEQELQGKVLIAAQQQIAEKRKKKPCPNCTSEKVYKRGRQKGVQMYQCNECKRWYLVKQQGHLCMTSSLNQNGNLICAAWSRACR